MWNYTFAEHLNNYKLIPLLNYWINSCGDDRCLGQRWQWIKTGSARSPTHLGWLIAAYRSLEEVLIASSVANCSLHTCTRPRRLLERSESGERISLRSGSQSIFCCPWRWSSPLDRGRCAGLCGSKRPGRKDGLSELKISDSRHRS